MKYNWIWLGLFCVSVQANEFQQIYSNSQTQYRYDERFAPAKTQLPSSSTSSRFRPDPLLEKKAALLLNNKNKLPNYKVDLYRPIEDTFTHSQQGFKATIQQIYYEPPYQEKPYTWDNPRINYHSKKKYKMPNLFENDLESNFDW